MECEYTFKDFLRRISSNCSAYYQPTTDSKEHQNHMLSGEQPLKKLQTYVNQASAQFGRISFVH